MSVASLHPGVTREAVRDATGWPVRFAAGVAETPPPTAAELTVLRELHRRTAAAHGKAA
jgi:glutaconate CoA-transferase subunit B